MVTRNIKCVACGHEGKVEAHDIVNVVPESEIFKNLGKDPSTGFPHFSCPSCNEDLAVDPLKGLTAKQMVGYPDSDITPGQAQRINRHAPRKRQLCILIGDSRDNIAELLPDLIEEVVVDKYDLKVMYTVYANEILKLAENNVFDIFILMLNNIRFSSKNLPPEKRVKKSLQFVTHLRTTYEKPVIALFGWPNDPSFAEKAKHAGANFVIKLPFEPKDFEEAFKKCLDKIA